MTSIECQFCSSPLDILFILLSFFLLPPHSSTRCVLLLSNIIQSLCTMLCLLLQTRKLSGGIAAAELGKVESKWKFSHHFSIYFHSFLHSSSCRVSPSLSGWMLHESEKRKVFNITDTFHLRFFLSSPPFFSSHILLRQMTSSSRESEHSTLKLYEIKISELWMNTAIFPFVVRSIMLLSLLWLSSSLFLSSFSEHLLSVVPDFRSLSSPRFFFIECRQEREK